MSPSHQPPAHLRYLKARLRPVTKPIVWGTATVLSLAGALTWTYFNHPEWLALTDNQQNSVSNNADNQPDLSQEDKSIGADIDRLSVLEQDLAEFAPTVVPGTSSEKDKDTFLDEVMKKRQDGDGSKLPSLSGDKLLPEQSVANPFAAKSLNLFSNSRNTSSGNSSLGTYSNLIGETAPNASGSLNLSTSVNQNSGAAPVSPLQSALERSTGNRSNIQNPNSTSVSPLQSALNRDSEGNRSNIQKSDPTSVSPLQSALEDNTSDNFTGTSKQTIAEKLGQNSTQLSGQNPDGRLTPTEPYPGTPSQTATPVSPYSGLTSYPNLPGQGYTPSPYPVPGATGYNVPSDNSNSINSYTYLNQPQVPTVVAPPVQINPSVTTVTPNNLGQSPFQSTIPSTGYSNPGFNPNSVNSGLQPYQMQTPSNFSVPRPIPGRYIGGGQINTFSNP